jgi:hypothetical protein
MQARARGGSPSAVRARGGSPRMKLSTASAKPSCSFELVTWRATRWTSAPALPMAMLRPAMLSIEMSLGMSPIVAISSRGIRRMRDASRTTIPLFASGWVMSR